MGFEVVIALASAAAGVAGSFMQANATRQAASEQRRAREISSNQQRVEGLESRRQRIREERIRRARIEASAANVGVTGSSGELGALGALGTNVSTMFSQASGRSLAAEGISQANQNAADWLQRADTIGAWSNTIQSTLNTFSSSVFDN